MFNSFVSDLFPFTASTYFIVFWCDTSIIFFFLLCDSTVEFCYQLYLFFIIYYPQENHPPKKTFSHHIFRSINIPKGREKEQIINKLKDASNKSIILGPDGSPGPTDLPVHQYPVDQNCHQLTQKSNGPAVPQILQQAGGNNNQKGTVRSANSAGPGQPLQDIGVVPPGHRRGKGPHRLGGHEQPQATPARGLACLRQPEDRVGAEKTSSSGLHQFVLPLQP